MLYSCFSFVVNVVVIDVNSDAVGSVADDDVIAVFVAAVVVT